MAFILCVKIIHVALGAIYRTVATTLLISLMLATACSRKAPDATLASIPITASASLTMSLVWTNGASAINYPEWGDYDGDGDLDIAGIVDGKVKVFRNGGAGALPRFVKVWESTLPDAPRQLQWGDYDRDGFLDLAVANYAEGVVRIPVRVYRYSGNDTFSAIDLPGTIDGGNVSWADIEGDGYPDLTIVRNWDAVYIYGNKEGVLTLRRRSATPAPGRGRPGETAMKMVFRTSS